MGKVYLTPEAAFAFTKCIGHLQDKHASATIDVLGYMKASTATKTSSMAASCTWCSGELGEKAREFAVKAWTSYDGSRTQKASS